MDDNNLFICKHMRGAGYCVFFGGYCYEVPCSEQVLVEYAPVKHGKWELEYETYGKMRCSACKKEALLEKAIGDVGVITLYVDSDYCPNCGARMDLKEG